jgi:hypothetical protein
VIGMPFLGIAKHRLANSLGSVATRGEGTQNLLCAYLAAAVLVGLLGNALFGLWWLDPAAALVVAAVALKEGRESWRGEGCCRVTSLRVSAADPVAVSPCRLTLPTCSLEPDQLTLLRHHPSPLSARKHRVIVMSYLPPWPTKPTTGRRRSSAPAAPSR